jgi:1,2-diacylglycerol 3-beta-galactosyltransferase
MQYNAAPIRDDPPHQPLPVDTRHAQTPWLTLQTAKLPRICILLANTGGGHRSVALSLAEALNGRAEVTLLNLLDEYAPFPLNHLSRLYGPWTDHAPGLWYMAYRFGASRRRIVLSERAAGWWVRSRVSVPLIEHAGDMVISVHPIQTGVPWRILRDAGSQAAFVTMVTDPIVPAPSWLCPDVDLCLVATEQARRTAEQSGVPANKLHVVGLPVRRSFSVAGSVPKPEARRHLGLPTDMPLILLTGGGAGIGRLSELARALVTELHTAHMEAQLAIFTGHNASLRRRLQTENWLLPVYALDYVNDPAPWFSAADLLLTKAGPTTLYEAGCTGLPMILTGFIPGQETANVTWVETAGAGVYAPEPTRAARIATQWLSDGPVLDTIAARARALPQPDAANKVADLVLAFLKDRATA